MTVVVVVTCLYSGATANLGSLAKAPTTRSARKSVHREKKGIGLDRLKIHHVPENIPLEKSTVIYPWRAL